MKQIIIRFLLLFYLSSSFLSATHIHKNLKAHDDCKVCIVVKNLHSGDVPSFETLDFVSLLPEEIVLRPKQFHSIVINKGFFSHAPPFFS